MTRWIALAALLPFGAYSTWVTIEHGYFGFLDLGKDGWGLQVLLDLTISLAMVSVGIVRDARTRRVAAWPWILLTLVLGSIGPLLYFVTRPGLRAIEPAPDRA